MPGSILEKLIRDGEAQSPREANAALAKPPVPVKRYWSRRKHRRRRRRTTEPLQIDLHFGSRRLTGPGMVDRGITRTPFADGRDRRLQMLEAMAEVPDAWWGRADLRRVLVPRGWSYNSIKAIIAKLLRQGWLERREIGEPPRAGGSSIKAGRAYRLFRATRAGRELVELCR